MMPMIDFLYNVSIAYVDALKECVDFCKNGYIVIIRTKLYDSYYIKLRHLKNGHTITVDILDNGYMIFRDKKCVKKRVYAFDSIRYDLIVNSDRNKIYSIHKDD